jgi:hypothetical protein
MKSDKVDEIAELAGRVGYCDAAPLPRGYESQASEYLYGPYVRFDVTDLADQ